ncbi:hypothetical protein Pmani_040168 [Petrolisthes manimaculis]|uniref:Uncharacterized protein n=1 Tax=Petrolisthes manimaculis TaxID=1843537 RepID=A0AAE1NDT6_9EUCA|nr:hypothetical protein Pmani_040168 [Petrolisthes manimaculis]
MWRRKRARGRGGGCGGGKEPREEEDVDGGGKERSEPSERLASHLIGLLETDRLCYWPIPVDSHADWLAGCRGAPVNTQPFVRPSLSRLFDLVTANQVAKGRQDWLVPIGGGSPIPRRLGGNDAAREEGRERE